ncbi:DUF6804 family protein [Ulvibacter antarcticus]|nr:DUF6804 family protein [Ulvibacter antarcticus]
MNVTLLKSKNRLISLICAGMLLFALLNLPIEYYTLLRIVVFIGALLVVVENLKKLHWLFIFLLIAILFNPVYPVYLLQKGIWMPIDLVCAALFVIEAIKKSEDDSPVTTDNTDEAKKYQRDKII